ncbi:helix-turn-helix domain-containing protein [Halomonas sp. BC04]|uniref:helix-turn-helix domain-containing protein n=1 Tax=Halomonas sp. BC04 TaxID=1403540 RepID=UPI0003ED88F3|nr:helix-turn-helix transcriptional regulator [Halomonas sp. BC04]EWG98685.1 XRE family transcriptional regulator [Halomonas sp. BC04]
MHALGPRIKQLRIEASLNKAALARKVGVSDVTISYWESGAIKQIGHERLVALADALGCPLRRLLEDDSVDLLSAPLYLRSQPPAPWHDPNANRITLPEGFLVGTNWQGECYLVTPAPGECFDYLGTGDLAAIGPIKTYDQPGHYLIEGEMGLFIGQLERSQDGELLYRGERSATSQATPLEKSDQPVGRLLARWRQEGG